MTVELDEATLLRLKRLSEAWGVTTAEAVRLALQSVAENRPPIPSQDRVQAFRELQCLLHLTPEQAEVWKAAIREARR